MPGGLKELRNLQVGGARAGGRGGGGELRTGDTALFQAEGALRVAAEPVRTAEAVLAETARPPGVERAEGECQRIHAVGRKQAMH